jgi:hypothetical protein
VSGIEDVRRTRMSEVIPEDPDRGDDVEGDDDAQEEETETESE